MRLSLNAIIPRTHWFFLLGRIAGALASGFVAFLDMTIGAALGVLVLLTWLPLLWRTKTSSSFFGSALLPVIGVLGGFQIGRVYLDHTIKAHLSDFHRIAASYSAKRIRTIAALAPGEAQLAKAISFPESDGVVTSFVLINGELLVYVPRSHDKALWRDRRCVREIASDWFIQARCESL